MPFKATFICWLGSCSSCCCCETILGTQWMGGLDLHCQILFEVHCCIKAESKKLPFGRYPSNGQLLRQLPCKLIPVKKVEIDTPLRLYPLTFDRQMFGTKGVCGYIKERVGEQGLRWYELGFFPKYFPNFPSALEQLQLQHPAHPLLISERITRSVSYIQLAN